MVGIDGILLAQKYFVSPMGGWDIHVKSWVITAFGGMGSIRGGLIAALIMGMREPMTVARSGTILNFPPQADTLSAKCR